MSDLHFRFVIFSVLGFMAHEQGKDVGDVAESGRTLYYYPGHTGQVFLSAGVLTGQFVCNFHK